MNTPKLDAVPDVEFRETRNRGREIDAGYAILAALTKILASKDCDIYNEKGKVEQYESNVDSLARLLAGNKDRDYHEESKEINEYVEAIKNTEIENPIYFLIDVIGWRWEALQRLMTRKGYWPGQDVMGNYHIVVDEILKLIHDNNDAMILVSGERGFGKSMVSLLLVIEICRRLLIDLKISNHVYFNSIFLRRFIDATKPIKKGFPFLYDEAGADKGMSRNRAQTRESKDFNELLQILRELHLVIFYTSPDEENLITKNVNMFAAKIELLKPDKENKTNYWKFKIKRKMGERIYWEYPRNSDGQRIVTITSPKVPDAIWEEYEKAKNAYVYDKVKVKKTRARHYLKHPEEGFNPHDYADTILKEGVEKVLKNGKINLVKIMNRFADKGLGRQKAEQIMYAVEAQLPQEKPKEENNNETQQGKPDDAV